MHSHACVFAHIIHTGAVVAAVRLLTCAVHTLLCSRHVESMLCACTLCAPARSASMPMCAASMPMCAYIAFPHANAACIALSHPLAPSCARTGSMKVGTPGKKSEQTGLEDATSLQGGNIMTATGAWRERQGKGGREGEGRHGREGGRALVRGGVEEARGCASETARERGR